MKKLKGSLIAVGDLSISDKRSMLHIMQKYYENVTEEKFYCDLNEKSSAIILKDTESDKIKGFSTIINIEAEVFGVPVKAVFSGDTIIDKDFWGDHWLVRLLGRYFLENIRNIPSMRLYWFLICKGYKTYRYLPLYFKKFYPCFNIETPPFEKTVIDSFALHKYPDNYDPVACLIRFNGKAEYLKEGVADVTDARLKNSHIDFFQKSNPGHLKGDELACVAELSKGNFSDVFYRIVLGDRWRIRKDEFFKTA